MSRLLKITDLGSGIMVQGTDNVLYPDNATLTYPYNSIVVVTDESDIATFRSASNNDVLFSGLIGKIEIGGEIVTKENINVKFDEIANQETGGGGSFADASYDSQTKRINFYDKDGNIVSYIDATDFIKDGMVSNVEILNGNLVITFNTDAGKENIEIPLSEIFNPNEYYTKTEIDAKEQSVNASIALKANITDLNAETTARQDADTTLQSNIDTKANIEDVYDKQTADSTFATQVVVNEEIASRIEAIRDVNTALGAKADKSDTYTKAQVDDALALKQDASTAFSGDYDDLTNKPTIPVVPTNVSAFTNDAGYLTEHQSLNDYYTKSEIDAALEGKEDAGDALTDIRNTSSTQISGFKGSLPSTTITFRTINNVGLVGNGNISVVETSELDNYYTKSEVDQAIPDTSDFLTKSEFDTKEEVISTALNELEDGKQEKLTAGSNITIDANNVISSTGGEQQQADWNQTDTTAVDYIKNKPDTSEFVTKAEYNPKERAIAEALTDLNENKADKTDIPNLNNYYTKTQTDAAIQTAVGQIDLSDYQTKADADVKEEVISTALNVINTSLNNKVNNLGGVANIVKISAADYAALATKDNNTLYIITTN